MLRLLIWSAMFFYCLLLTGCVSGQKHLEPPTATSSQTSASLPTITSESIESSSILTPSPTPTLIKPEPNEISETITAEVTENEQEAQALKERIQTQAIILYTRQEANKPFPLLAWPELSILDQPEFEGIYGQGPGFLYVDDFAPRLDTNGRFLMVPGLDPQATPGPESASTWLADLSDGTVRELAPRPTFAVWSPDGQQLAYSKDETLYLENVEETGQSQAIFTASGLEGFFLQWSPDGRNLAAISTAVGPSIDGAYPAITSTLWLVSAEDGAARPLGTFTPQSIEHDRRELQWSSDGSALFSAVSQPNYLFTLDGEQMVLENVSQTLAWLPGQLNLLIRVNDGHLVVMDAQSQETVMQVTEVGRRVTAWAFSNGGAHLAFVYAKQGNEPLEIYQFDLASRETSLIGTVAAEIVTAVHWTPDDDILVLNDAGWNTPIWGLDVALGGTASELLRGTLLNVIRRPAEFEQ